MADSNEAEEQRPYRFFCYTCDTELVDVMPDFTCPFCTGGFVEQIEYSTDGLSGDSFSDADMSNIEDMSNLDESDMHPIVPAVFNDLAFLMTGGRLRTNTITAGAPFVFVGAPGDYVFGGEGLDAVVTHLRGQLENAGPPPLPREPLAALPDEPVTEEQAAANTICSICWDNFVLGETVCRLECEHVFHSNCIRPWLRLHATCPICRRSLLPAGTPAAPSLANVAVTAAPFFASISGAVPDAAAATGASGPSSTATPNPLEASANAIRTSIAAALPRVLLRRIVQRPARPCPAPSASTSSTSNTSTSNTSNYDMDIDMD
ncbi:E3 ubiquitin-protein ligase Iruka-like isoform X2 [Epargyreus clarus]|uniref:E3 ubiquitin-protein ligase Iruka-like isoform X2 n=1 Tax=Epargyreus clarus TaxID=520877 RepID=UPI003C2DE36A